MWIKFVWIFAPSYSQTTSIGTQKLRFFPKTLFVRHKCKDKGTFQAAIFVWHVEMDRTYHHVFTKFTHQDWSSAVKNIKPEKIDLRTTIGYSTILYSRKIYPAFSTFYSFTSRTHRPFQTWRRNVSQCAVYRLRTTKHKTMPAQQPPWLKQIVGDAVARLFRVNISRFALRK